MLVAVVGATAGAARAADVTKRHDRWNEAIEGQLFDYYQSPETHQGMKPASVEGGDHGRVEISGGQWQRQRMGRRILFRLR